MKKLTTIVFFSFLLFSSCSQENDTFNELLPNETLSEKITVTRSLTTSSFDECDECITVDGDTIKTPWCANATTSVPEDVRMDVKESDGWRILYSNFRIVGCSNNYNNLNNAYYLILYNVNTAMLKGFYYAKTMQRNNQAFWQLKASQGNTKLFNFAGEFAKPANTNATNIISLSNITVNGMAGGFDVGWNCFQQELSYDPNSMNQRLDISAYAMNETQYTFNGNFSSTSEGCIVSAPQGMSSSLNGVANGLGEYAKTEVGNLDLPGVSKVILSNLAQVATSSLVGYGVNLVLGSFLSQSSPTVQSLQFTSNGKMKVTGTSQTPMTGYLTPLAGVPLNSLGVRLGVWNLQTTPIYRSKYLPRLKKVKLMSDGHFIFVYQADMESVVSFVTNPDVNATITTSFKPVRYERYDGGWPPLGLIFSDVYVLDPTGYSYMTPTLIYEDDYTKITTMPSSYIINAKDYYPNYTSSNNLPAADFSGFEYEVRQPVVIKATAKIKPSTNNTVISTKSFIPNNYLRYYNDRYDNWTHSELRDKGYL